MHAPGGPEEDASSSFKYGGWVAPFFYEADEAAGEFMAKRMKSADLLLGRKTFEIFASFWPEHAEMWPGIAEAGYSLHVRARHPGFLDALGNVAHICYDNVKELVVSCDIVALCVSTDENVMQILETSPTPPEICVERVKPLRFAPANE